MNVNATAASPAPATGRTASTTDTKGQFDYLKLIVAQMRNVNPMDPNGGSDSLPIMIAAESLNQITKLNTAMRDLQTMSQTSYASSLVGRTVSGVNEQNVQVSGAVQGLSMEATGPVLRLANGSRLNLLDISDVSAG